MYLQIKPSKAKGIVVVPPSKSYAHRYLIAAALAGDTIIKNVDLSNDIIATFDSLNNIGYDLYYRNSRVFSAGKIEKKPIHVVDARESGSTLRFLIPLASSQNDHSSFIGSNKLFSRGIEVYEDIFNKQNISYDLTDNSLYVNGRLSSGTFDVSGTISSQYISGLLMSLPILNKDSLIRVEGKIESEPYIDITVDVLKQFGIVITKIANTYFIKGNQQYKSGIFTVEGDYSNAAFLDALNLIGGEVLLKGLNENSLQGDKIYKKHFQELQNSHPVIDISNCIDLGPILFVVASIFNGAIFKGTKRLKIKESDRVDEMMEVLQHFGVSSRVEENEVEIYKSELRPTDEIIDLPNDHRIIMATSVLLTLVGGKVRGYASVKKSFPNFFDVLKQLGIEVSYEKD